VFKGVTNLGLLFDVVQYEWLVFPPICGPIIDLDFKDGNVSRGNGFSNFLDTAQYDEFGDEILLVFDIVVKLFELGNLFHRKMVNLLNLFFFDLS
jgi:hypothetical protein